MLHHSISSSKRRNKRWLHFQGVSLPEGAADKGGYFWAGGITQTIVKLEPDHFITTNKVSYPEQVPFKAATDAEERTCPGFTLKDSEVYMNHVLEKDNSRTCLLGVKYNDSHTGRTYMQTHAGWVKASGKGWIVYLQPGHSIRDLENPTFARILLNAVLWKPTAHEP